MALLQVKQKEGLIFSNAIDLFEINNGAFQKINRPPDFRNNMIRHTYNAFKNYIKDNYQYIPSFKLFDFHYKI